MVMFDMMVSHHKMTSWHEVALDQHTIAMGRFRDAKGACHARIRDEHSPVKKIHSDAIAESIAALLEADSAASGLIKAVSGRPVVKLPAFVLQPLNFACQALLVWNLSLVTSLFATLHDAACLSCMQVTGVQISASASTSAIGSYKLQPKLSLSESTSGVRQLLRSCSRGSQALQMARSLGKAGGRFSKGHCCVTSPFGIDRSHQQMGTQLGCGNCLRTCETLSISSYSQLKKICAIAAEEITTALVLSGVRRQGIEVEGPKQGAPGANGANPTKDALEELQVHTRAQAESSPLNIVCLCPVC